MIYIQAKIWIIQPFHFLENLRKYISAIYWQNYTLHFQPFIDVPKDIFQYQLGVLNQKQILN